MTAALMVLTCFALLTIIVAGLMITVGVLSALNDGEWR
jgi:hypothetical protein